MSVNIILSETFGDYRDAQPLGWENAEDFFIAYEAHFEIADHSDNPGAFAGPQDPNPVVDTGIWGSLFGPFSGTQYVLEGETSELDLGFIVQSDLGLYLNYTFFSSPTHAMYGDINSITFGRGLELDEDTGEYYFLEELITIEGLDIIGLNGGIDEEGNVIDRETGDNDTHNIINELQEGNTSSLLEALEDAGVELDLISFVGTDNVVEIDMALVA
ncbi:MAG: heme acquisition protein HasA [Pseudomonadota bacterium]